MGQIGADAIPRIDVFNKIDLLPHVDFDVKYFRRGVEMLNEGLQVFPISCRTGEGLSSWTEWLATRKKPRDPSDRRGAS